ncbi:MAG: high-potential iron-sulfur protein [Burkholderiales bacterium]
MLAAGTLAVAAAALAPRARAADKVDEKDPTAAALGYVADAKKVNRKKFAKYQPGEHCAGCNLFKGKPGDAWGPCQIFQLKLVHAKGWCSAYVKKA